MRAEAFGEIGLLPSDFYRMKYSDYLLMQRGFNKQRNFTQRIARRVVTILVNIQLDKNKKLSEYQIWPVDGDDVLKAEDKETGIRVSEESLKRLREFKEKEKNQKAKDN